MSNLQRRGIVKVLASLSIALVFVYSYLQVYQTYVQVRELRETYFDLKSIECLTKMVDLSVVLYVNCLVTKSRGNSTENLFELIEQSISSYSKEFNDPGEIKVKIKVKRNFQNETFLSFIVTIEVFGSRMVSKLTREFDVSYKDGFFLLLSRKVTPSL